MPLSDSHDLAAHIDRELLKRLANKYIWWKTADEALAEPARIVAQVMNMGDYADVQTLAVHTGDDVLKSVLAHADAGQFDERSWTYWHYPAGSRRRRTRSTYAGSKNRLMASPNTVSASSKERPFFVTRLQSRYMMTNIAATKNGG